jgi:uncharacterized protein (TIGR02246 family)
MRTRIVLPCLAAAAFVALAFALTRTNNAAPDDKSDRVVKGDGDRASKAEADKSDNEDEAAIKKAVNDYSAAYAKGDLEAVLATWTRDAEFTDDDGKVYRGRESLEPIFKKTLPSFKGYRITAKLTSIQLIKPDVALVDGEQTFMPPQGESDVSRFTSVWVKTDGKWRIRSARDLTAEPAGETVAGRHLRDLDWMIGDWISESNDGSVLLNVSWGLNKAFLVWNYDVKRKQGTGSKVAQWVGWDPLTEQTKSWVFDDQGGYGTAYWTRSGNTWTLEAGGVLPDGTTGSAANVVKYVDDKTFLWQSLRREADGQPLPDVEAKFTRQAAKP